MAKFTLSGKQYDVEMKDVENAMKGVEPGKIQKYAVQVGKKLYPIKHVIAKTLKLTSADFTSHDAYRALRAIGYPISCYD
ncbi:MAG: hypothetical protein Q8L74_11765 [Nitrospirota bacterium]|nr:hypothetical protein [Nitrospirota bacterium]MDP2381586.1 hypothetical protein [Nitrospirota bacterium]